LPVSTQQDAIGPRRDPVLLRGVVHVTVEIEFVSRYKLNLSLCKIVKDFFAVFPGLEELVLGKQALKVTPLNLGSDFFVGKINSEVHISKKTLVVVEALLLS